MIFTAVVTGDGQLGGQSVYDLTAAISPKQSFGIAETPRRTQDGRWDITAIFSNLNLGAGYWFREWAIHARDPDTLADVLVLYANAGSTSDYIPKWEPDDTSTHINYSLTCASKVSSDVEVTIDVDPSTLFIPMSQKGAPGGVATAHYYTAAVVTTWSGSGPYTQTVSIPGVLASDQIADAGPLFDASVNVRADQRDAWGMISLIDTIDDGLVITCDEDAPTTAVPFQLAIIRGVS